MPHKHKRGKTDNEFYNLPPGLVAKPLPARDLTAKSKATGRKKREEKEREIKKYETKNKSQLEDDTPREFRRLMQFQSKKQQPPAPKASDGEGKKKRKRDTAEGQDNSTRKKKSGNTPAASTSTGDTATTTTNTESKPEPTMKILPGEKLSDFSARVDREMPLSEMKRSNQGAAPDAPKIREQRLTKHDKRLRRLQSQWREEEAKIVERETAEREEREEEMDDQLRLWKQWETEAGKKKGAPQKKKKNKGKGSGGNNGDSDDDAGADPWAKLNNRDRLNRPANPQDVVQAPPQLRKPGEKFKVRGGAKVNVANVPAAMGSLRRREELADERKNIVEEYRRLMAEKRQ